MRKSALLIVLCLILVGSAKLEAFEAEAIKGPHIEELYMVVIKDPDAQILALEKGEVDMVGDIASPALIEKLSKKKDSIFLSLSETFHMFLLGFNFKRHPWDDLDLRRSACQVIEKESIVRDLFSGYSRSIEGFLPPISPYYNGDHKICPYNPSEAKARLRKSGWRWDKKGTLIPPGSNEPLKKISIICPTAQTAPTTSEIAIRIAQSFSSLGIPTEAEPMDFSSMVDRLDKRDFESYVMAWNLTRDPDVLYSFYSSEMDVPGGYNMTGIEDEKLDRYLNDLRYAPDKETAHRSSDEAQARLSQLLPVIPIYSRYSISAIRKDWIDYVWTKSTSVENKWTLMSVKPKEGPMKPFRMALADDPKNLNPFTASTATSWNVLTMIYGSLIDIDPETLEDIPGLAESWTVKTIEEGKARKTQLILKIRHGVKWQDGSTLTSSDPARTIEFIRENEIPHFYDRVKDVDRIETPDDYTLIVTMKNVSFWDFHNVAGLIVLPKKQIDLLKDWQAWQPLRETDPEMRLIGTGPFMLDEYRPGEFVKLRTNKNYWRKRL